MSIRQTISIIKKLILQSVFIALGVHGAFAQNLDGIDSLSSISPLFRSSELLYLKLSYSNKALKEKTNDSTYLDSDLSYLAEDDTWKTMPVQLRARGNFRRRNCLNTPIKIKIKRKVSETSLFEGNKKLKLVLPCFNYAGYDDYIVKEYLAYKLYEIVSHYHFKTRLVSITVSDSSRRKTKTRKLLGFLIEDLKNVADRGKGNVLKRHMQPQTQDATTSVQNALFQFMIANTDFSTTVQHNQKQLWADQKIYPIPYDFDLSGFVNASYAVVSKVQNRKLPIEDVTERMYRGFQRDEAVFEAVQKHYVSNKAQMLAVLNDHQGLFNRNLEFVLAKDFIKNFYKIIENDRRFEKNVIDMARPMVMRKLSTK